MTEWLDLYPGARFKLDVGPGWDDELVRKLAATGAVEVVDLKGAYKGTPVDLDADPELYARVANGLPDVWIEDPALTEATDAVLAGHRPRITWDAPIHSVDDIRGLAFPPRVVNIKPSRFGTLRKLFDARQRLSDLLTKLDGNDELDNLLKDVVASTESLNQLKSLTASESDPDKAE